MKCSRFIGPILRSVGIVLFALAVPVTIAQGTTPQGASSGNVLGQMSASFSGDQVVQRVRLSDNATWSMGSSEYPEPANSIAATNDSSRMRLASAAIGLTLM
jgi:poly-D-alanine transfer protein DltD